MWQRTLAMFAFLGLANAITPTLTVIGGGKGGDRQGIGLLLAFGDCDSTNGCSVNKTEAYYKIYDDSATPAQKGTDEKCSRIKSSLDADASKNKIDAAQTNFFLAFTMTAGHKGKMKMSKNCILSGGTSAGWPTLDTYEVNLISGTTRNNVLQFTNQRFHSHTTSALSAGDKDIYIPYLMMATPLSVDGAMTVSANGRRTKQWTYVDATSNVNLYFSEKMSVPIGSDAKAYLYEFKPSTSAVPSGTPAAIHNLVLNVVEDAPFYGTKVTATMPNVPKNRLYSLVIDAGALEDAEQNAFGGINGYGSSASTCTAINPKPIGRNCAVKFVVPYTQSDVETLFPERLGGNISLQTNAIFAFKDAVFRGSWSATGASAQVDFGNELTGEEVQVLYEGSSTATDTNNYFTTQANKVHLIEPKQALKKGDTKPTQVNVTFAAGVFDYVDSVSYNFLSNPTVWGIKAPEIAYFSLYGTDKIVNTYYDSGEPLVVMDSNQKILELYFDTRVQAATDGLIVLAPDSYRNKPQSQWQNVTAKDACYDEALTAIPADVTEAAYQLTTCSFKASSSSIVTARGNSKFEIDIGRLIPGETYTLTIKAGAFKTSDLVAQNAEWSTRFQVNNTLKECMVGGTLFVASTSPTVPVHKTTSIRLAFNGPLKLIEGGAVSFLAGAERFDQLFSDADAVFHRNKDGATAPTGTGSVPLRYMMVIDPRQNADKDFLPEDKEFKVTVADGAIQNFQAPAAGLCKFTTLKEDEEKPKTLSFSHNGGSAPTSYGLTNSGAGASTVMTLKFSEKVVWASGASVPKIALKQGSVEYTFCASGCTYAVTLLTTGARDMTLTMTTRLSPGLWTLTVPKEALVDTAGATGGTANTLAATKTFTVNVNADEWSPSCTIQKRMNILYDGNVQEAAR